ncbi:MULTISPECIES: hypothetical protein [Corallincola]|uniref:Uncharacterized protein n=2 Tax=Corallincola TaxID=1775176 RepID=A0A368NIK7_9GAMM|nr:MULTISPECIES: hypothetical protein [Corallincola]RCU49585.1 hypothetical protein DU002_11760 [Corallincola holothuriorum]TAA47881.1 hypothetical protein EXY25_01130 [Corallincola spongiicola]
MLKVSSIRISDTFVKSVRDGCPAKPAGGFGEDLIEALEPIFLQLPVEGFVASLGSDSGS